jgi:hypothetical protein
MDLPPRITVSPETWDKIGGIMPEMLADIAASDRSQFRPLSEFKAKIRAETAGDGGGGC